MSWPEGCPSLPEAQPVLKARGTECSSAGRGLQPGPPGARKDLPVPLPPNATGPRASSGLHPRQAHPLLPQLRHSFRGSRFGHFDGNSWCTRCGRLPSTVPPTPHRELLSVRPPVSAQQETPTRRPEPGPLRLPARPHPETGSSSRTHGAGQGECGGQPRFTQAKRKVRGACRPRF